MKHKKGRLKMLMGSWSRKAHRHVKRDLESQKLFKEGKLEL